MDSIKRQSNNEFIASVAFQMQKERDKAENERIRLERLEDDQKECAKFGFNNSIEDIDCYLTNMSNAD